MEKRDFDNKGIKAWMFEGVYEQRLMLMHWMKRQYNSNGDTYWTEICHEYPYLKEWE